MCGGILHSTPLDGGALPTAIGELWAFSFRDLL